MDRSICEVCSHMKEVTSGTGSRLLLRQLSQSDRRFHKYPPQPVVRCARFNDRKTSRSMNIDLIVLSDTFAICCLDGDAPIPHWASGDFVSVTRTTDELTIVCRQDDVPDGVQRESGWRCLRVAGKLQFSMIGVIASLTGALAEADVSVFVISTNDTDFMLVREKDLNNAVAALEESGHVVAGVR